MILMKISIIIILLSQLLSIVTGQNAAKNIYDNIVADVPQLLALGVLLNQTPKFVAKLKAKGAFTFFAPSGPALGTVSATAEELEQILSYHLVQGKFLSKAIPPVSYQKTILKIPPAKAEELVVLEKTPSGGVQVRSGWKTSTVQVVDQVANNGVIHIVDTVLGIPMSPMDTLTQNGDFKSMITILSAPNFGNLAGEIGKMVGVTILALTDDVIANTPKDIAKHLEFVDQIFSYHIIPNEIIFSGSIETVLTTKTLKDELITFTRQDGGLFVGNARTKAKITRTDIYAKQGVLHVLDSILIPPSIPDVSTTFVPQQNPTTIATDTTSSASSPSSSPSSVPLASSSPNVAVIVAATLGGIIGGGLLMLGGFFLIYKRFTKKNRRSQELFPYYYDLGHNNANSQPSHYSNYSNSNDYYSNSNTNDNRQITSHYSNTSNGNYSIPTTTNQSVYIGNE